MKGQMLKLLVVTVAFLLIAGACVPAATPPPTPTPVPPTPTPDPAAPVQAWADAINSGDVDAALALFTDNVLYSIFDFIAGGKDRTAHDVRLAGRAGIEIPDHGVPTAAKIAVVSAPSPLSTVVSRATAPPVACP